MKYIFIIAEDGDVAVDEIFHWLKYLSDIKIVRINDTDKYDVVNITIGGNGKSSFTLIINDELQVNSDEICAYYYRRGEIRYNSVHASQKGSLVLNAFTDGLNQYFKREWEHVHEYIHFLLKQLNITSLNSHFDLEVNKLTNLFIASQIGLNIPETLVSSDVQKIAEFINDKDKVIVKPINFSGSQFYLDTSKIFFSQPTNIFTSSHLESLLARHTQFQPTLFQEYIEKEFEIRVFYLKGAIHAMAIFSQENENTKLDFRHYDKERPNRCVPYSLPFAIKDLVIKFMERKGYDTGSIDIIYTPAGSYYFLEVNTVGQFSWVSKNCNYFLERHIALQLI